MSDGNWSLLVVATIGLLWAFALLALTGCAVQAHEAGVPDGPPLYVHLCSAMPAADKEAWGAAAGEINLREPEPVLWVGNGPPIGCSTVDVCFGRVAAATIGADSCTAVIRYPAGEAEGWALTGLGVALELVR